MPRGVKKGLDTKKFDECVEKAIQGCKKVYEIQRKALIEKYFGNDLPESEEKELEEGKEN